MSWFRELLLPMPGTAEPVASSRLVPFYTGIATLPTEVLLGCWAGPPWLEDPRGGLVIGADAFTRYVEQTREWLALSDAGARTLTRSGTQARAVEEVLLDPEVGGVRQELGAAVLTERDADHRLTAVRIYHSMRAMPDLPVHLPATTPEPDLVLPRFVQALHQAREGGDADAVLECYEDGAQVTRFDAGTEVHSGRDGLQRLHAGTGVAGARATTGLCSVTDDGRTCAVEYRVSQPGTAAPEQAGLSLYARGPAGRIAEERHYLVTGRSAFAPTATPSAPARPGSAPAAGAYADAGSGPR